MGNRLSKLYTKTGDKGETGLGDGSRVAKTDTRVWAMGDVDELNSVIGMLIEHCEMETIRECLRDIQHVLFNLGGELSIPGAELVFDKNVLTLETLIDNHNENLPALKEFILPGGSIAAGTCHLARAVCRRAERRVIALARDEAVNQHALVYLNRLSDLLFVFARILARHAGGEEVYWQKDRL
ncbi:MAG: cob(I)yrinic acid a,c-diamide adenosyltransferase [Gammaproteobacteria bacterium]|nr:cob(I)yrinic acid a,c-diamide adenosyltransferase [Gammaproteobacteria bacterium]